MLVGHRLDRAAQHMLTLAGQRVPAVRAGDHQQVPGGPDLNRSVPRGRAGQIRSVDLGQLPEAQQAEPLIQASDGPGRARLAGPGTAGEYQVLPRRAADLDTGPAPGLLRLQHGEQRRDLPGDLLQAGQRGQLAHVQLEPGDTA
jgi:hypothetical protein